MLKHCILKLIRFIINIPLPHFFNFILPLQQKTAVTIGNWLKIFCKLKLCAFLLDEIHYQSTHAFLFPARRQPGTKTCSLSNQAEWAGGCEAKFKCGARFWNLLRGRCLPVEIWARRAACADAAADVCFMFAGAQVWHHKFAPSWKIPRATPPPATSIQFCTCGPRAALTINWVIYSGSPLFMSKRLSGWD